MAITYGRANSEKDLKEILELQGRNLPGQLSEFEKEKEGFVTVSHSPGLLKSMNAICPHIVALDQGGVVGYALCMHPDFSKEIPILIPMFEEIEKAMENTSYIVMGQICIEKNYRGKGIFRGLYNTMKEVLINSYELIVTEVDNRNTRSLNAHLAVGFRVLKKYQSHERDWYLIAL